MPPCERDNNCYHECEEAEADGGIVFQTDAKKKEEGQRKVRNSIQYRSSTRRNAG